TVSFVHQKGRVRSSQYSQPSHQGSQQCSEFGLLGIQTVIWYCSSIILAGRDTAVPSSCSDQSTHQGLHTDRVEQLKDPSNNPSLQSSSPKSQTIPAFSQVHQTAHVVVGCQCDLWH
ncbi:hypothetical protein PSTT_03741, partial [Puccinia striiformis]